MIEVNEHQTPIEDLNLGEAPKEIQEQFYDFINTVPYIRSLISKDRPRAADLPKDEKGRIIVDITKPHILEDMDYFRPSAIHFQQTGRFTDLAPNGNPNSEYGKWMDEEIRRCFEGMVRPSDGEWITGDYYFFLNYCPILQAKKDKKDSKKANRVVDFPKVWEGHYYKTHYLNQARNNGHHASELASRGKGKSYLGAALLAKRFILGESYEVCREVQSVVTAYERKYITGANQILDMFKKYIDFLATNTQWPYKRLVDSLQNLQWKMGYKDLDTGAERGTLNSVIGITSKDDESKLRGSRGVLYLLEEAGTFPRLLGIYSTLRPSVEAGDDVFGMLFAYGTAGDNNSDFAAMKELMYNPRGYNMQSVENVYDKEGQGRPEFTYFFPGYINRENCYDNDGNSDVTKALLEILRDRYTIKYHSTDINAITKRIAEIPITPQEAILKSRGNLFPVTELTERLNQIDNNPSEYNDVYIGTLIQTGKTIEFKPTTDLPLREFPLKDNKAVGAIEIFSLPERDKDGNVFSERYILGHDPVDDDESETLSLTSTFVLDLWTDKIVAEYTGRQSFADDNYEIVRKLCMFYNGKCLYENNKKGIFAYFSKMNSVHLLADTPEYLKDKNLIKVIGVGNKAKGVNATNAINNYANTLIRDWLLLPRTSIKKINGEEQEVTEFNLYSIRNRALLKELILFNPDINVDRVRALGMLMLYRQEKMILYQGDVEKSKKPANASYLGNDSFFTRNYEGKGYTY